MSKACNLFILDKGKPVERPGRKAKDRRIVSAGSLAAERVNRHFGFEVLKGFVVTKTESKE